MIVVVLQWSVSMELHAMNIITLVQIVTHNTYIKKDSKYQKMAIEKVCHLNTVNY